MCGNEMSVPVVAPTNFTEMLLNRIVNKQLIINHYHIKRHDAEIFHCLDGMNIEYMDLSRCGIGNEQFRQISKVSLPGLIVLKLDGNRLNSQAIESMALSDSFSKIRCLHLNNNFLGNEGVIALSNSHFPNLSDLRLCQNKLTDAGISVIDSNNFPTLEYLYLTHNNIDDQSTKKLAMATWKNLYVIMLSFNNISNVGAESLRKAQWAKIQVVFLDFNKITKNKKELKFKNPSTFILV